MNKKLLATASMLMLSACDFAPDLVMPDITVPQMFKEGASTAETVEPASDGKWKRFDDKAKIEEFAWWRMFNDAGLDALEEMAMKDNPSLEVAAARLEKARAEVTDADADLYPEISVGAGPTITRTSPDSIRPKGFAYTKAHTTYAARGTINYEFDLFGKYRNLSKIAEMNAEGEDQNYRAARLSLQAELAQSYFQLAALKAELDLLERSAKTREQALTLTQKKHEVGAVDDAALAAAQSDLATVAAERAGVAQQRAVQEHALAILVGQAPAALNVDPALLNQAPPVIPAGMPSHLLERRPDIQAAVKSIAAANANIGVARTGYFPDISISTVGGFASGELSDLFKWSNRTWTIGPLAGTMLTQPIFEGGRLSAAIAERNADYTGAVASYRGTVLQAFREVEDNLSGLRNLSEQGAATDNAVAAATRTEAIAQARYQEGATSYLEPLDAERSLLAAQRSAVQVMGNRYITTVQLVKALGGSWQTPPVKTPDITTQPMAPANADAPAATVTQEPAPPPSTEPAASDVPDPSSDKKPAADATELPAEILPPAASHADEAEQKQILDSIQDWWKTVSEPADAVGEQSPEASPPTP